MQGSKVRALPVGNQRSTRERPLAERRRKARCRKSPTGTHRVLLGQVRNGVEHGVCRYCGLKRRYSPEDGLSWEDWKLL